MKLSSLLMLLLVSAPASAYNGNKCMSKVVDKNFYGFAISTTSYVSSTGACAAIGLKTREDKIKHFLVHAARAKHPNRYGDLTGALPLGNAVATAPALPGRTPAVGIEGEYSIAYRELLNE